MARADMAYMDYMRITRYKSIKPCSLKLLEMVKHSARKIATTATRLCSADPTYLG